MAGKMAVIAGAAFFLSAAVPPASSPKVDSLAWLSGTWIAAEDDTWTEERWSSPRGGVMLGTSLSGRGDRARDYEFMRLAADKNSVVSFWASVRGLPPVPFRLVSVSIAEAVFENPAHDYPTRIVYRRRGNVLTATLTGRNGRNPQSWRYRRSAD